MAAVKTESFFGTRYVPLKTVLEQLGGTVEWDNEVKRATVHVNGKTILVSAEKKEVEANGQVFNLTETPLVQQGVLYVPEDFFSNVVGQTVALI